MRKTKLAIVLALLALLSGASGIVAAWSPAGAQDPWWNPDAHGAKPIKWQVYEDADYGFTLEYPQSWKAETTIDLRHPSPQPEWVLRRVSFSGHTGALGALDVDIFVAQDMDLSAWLKWVGDITAPFPVTEPNAWVAGCQAVVFVEGEVLTAFLSDGEHVYRLWYSEVYDQDGLQAYWHSLDTFRLPESVTTGARIPQSVMQSLTGEEYTASAVPTATCDTVYGQGCCGLQCPFCDTYFPCSRDPATHVDKGNCTWYVCYRSHLYNDAAFPFRHDAVTWWSQVPYYPFLWSRGYSPQKYTMNIAWWASNHVAYIPDYAGGALTIYEMDWCITCQRQRPSYLPAPDGYIFPYTGPQPYSLP